MNTRRTCGSWCAGSCRPASRFRLTACKHAVDQSHCRSSAALQTWHMLKCRQGSSTQRLSDGRTCFPSSFFARGCAGGLPCTVAQVLSSRATNEGGWLFLGAGSQEALWRHLLCYRLDDLQLDGALCSLLEANHRPQRRKGPAMTHDGRNELQRNSSRNKRCVSSAKQRPASTQPTPLKSACLAPDELGPWLPRPGSQLLPASAGTAWLVERRVCVSPTLTPEVVHFGRNLRQRFTAMVPWWAGSAGLICWQQLACEAPSYDADFARQLLAQHSNM